MSKITMAFRNCLYLVMLFGMSFYIVVSSFGLTKYAYALSDDECTEERLRDLGVAVVDCSGATTCNAANPTAGCVCGVSGVFEPEIPALERYKSAWNFLTTLHGLSPEAAAGFMGNLEAESGINPRNVQNSANDPGGVPDGPEIPIDATVIKVNKDTGETTTVPFRGNFGYGIAQWTTAGRQDRLIAFASSSNQSTGSFDLQLNWLWKELSEYYPGVLSVLQTPGISVQEASDVVLISYETPGSVILPPKGDSTEEIKQQTMTARGLLGQALYDDYVGTSGTYVSSDSCSGGGLADPDACDSRTRDLGIVDGYTEGQRIDIRLCEAEGAKVNSQMSKQTKDMFEAARAVGINLSAFSSYRTIDDQLSKWREFCGTDYPVTSEFAKPPCTGAPLARPGYSMHQSGLAIDIACDGVMIPETYEEAKDNLCYQWLVENAGAYEYKGFSKTSSSFEGWHWSTTGD